MLKTLTLSLSFAVALGMCGTSQAGPFHNHSEGCTTCGIASPQGPAVSPQAPYASPQGECAAPAAECGKKKCHLFEGLSGMGNKMSCGFGDLCKKMKPKPKMYTYEWVLKKKRVRCHKENPCGAPACESCSGVAPSAQSYASPQGYGSPQAYAAPTYGTGQAYGAGQAYGTGYSAPAYSGTHAAPNMSAAPAERGDEAPPAPEVAPSAAPAAPSAPPAPPAPSTPPTTSGLLFSTPSGN